MGLHAKGDRVVSKSVNRLLERLPRDPVTTMMQTMAGRMKKHVICLQILNSTKNDTKKGDTRTRRPRSDNDSVPVGAQQPARERENDATGEGAQKYKANLRLIARMDLSAETSETAADRWVPICAALAPLVTSVIVPLLG